MVSYFLYDILCLITCNNLVKIYTGMATEEGAGSQCPELLDPVLDRRHRSYLSAVRRQDLPTLRLRVPLQLLRLDERWIPRYVYVPNHCRFLVL